MFTYNTMQSFIAVLGMEPLQMVAPPSEDPRRLDEFPGALIDCLQAMIEAGIRPRDIVTPASLRNALTVAIAMGVYDFKREPGCLDDIRFPPLTKTCLKTAVNGNVDIHSVRISAAF